MIRLPIVLMIRHPPVAVPAAIAVAHRSLTQIGTVKLVALPISAASTRSSPSVPASTLGLTMPLAIVAATLIEMKAPAKFRHAEVITATRGLSAPVAIDVGIALAVSWKPFVKSNAAAVMMTMMRIREVPPIAATVCG